MPDHLISSAQQLTLPLRGKSLVLLASTINQVYKAWYCSYRKMTYLRVRPAEDPPSLLVVVLDADIASWVPPSNPSIESARIALEAVVEQLLVFTNTFLLLHPENRVSFLLYGRDGSHFAYPLVSSKIDDSASSAENDALDGVSAAGAAEDPDSVLHGLRDAVAASLSTCISAQASTSASSRRARVSPSLATALCLINRRRILKMDSPGAAPPPESKNGPPTATGGPSAGISALEKAARRAALGGQARILTVLSSPDAPEQYVPVMNCIFAAQRMGVSIDTCLLLPEKESTFFQQAAYLTGGVYLRPPGFDLTNPESLQQSLMTVFLPDTLSREIINMPAQGEVDFRASCFSTRAVISEGYTCSVCLATRDLAVGKSLTSCPTCRARFVKTTATAVARPGQRRPLPRIPAAPRRRVVAPPK
jgi:transcription initiation factor TFIIH subunit 3